MKGKRFNKWLETIMLCAALCACTNAVCAQSDNDDAKHYFDSLTALLNGNITPEERLELLGQISYEHYNVDSTAKYANMALELARKLKNSAMIGSAYNLLGWCSYIHDDSERACQYYREAINCFDSAGLTAQPFMLLLSLELYADTNLLVSNLSVSKNFIPRTFPCKYFALIKTLSALSSKANG